MFSVFGRILRHIVPSSASGSSLFSSDGEGGGKRCRWDGSCRSEHTVIYLLLQGGHLSAHGLATLSCVSRAFRSACEDESLWHLAAVMQWPSINASDVDSSILSSGGYRRLYQLLFTPRVGDIQLSVPTNQTHSLIDDVSLFLDLSHKGVSVFSRRLDGKKDLPQLQQAEAVVFRPPDLEVGAVLVDGRPALSRRALERCTRELHATCIGLRWRDNKFCLLLHGNLNSSGMIGGSVYGSFQSNFALPGMFQVMCLTVDVVVTVTSRVREVERRAEDPNTSVAALTDHPAQHPPHRPAPVPGTGDGAGADAGAAGGERVRGSAAAGATDAGGAAVAELGTGNATTQALQREAGAGGGGEGEGGVAAGEGGGGGVSAAVPAVISAANAAHLGNGIVAATTAGAAGVPEGTGTALVAAPAAPSAAAGTVAAAAAGAAAAGAGAAGAGAGAGTATAGAVGNTNTDTLLDIILGDMSFQIKVSADQGEGRRIKKDPKWLDLMWK